MGSHRLICLSSLNVFTQHCQPLGCENVSDLLLGHKDTWSVLLFLGQHRKEHAGWGKQREGLSLQTAEVSMDILSCLFTRRFIPTKDRLEIMSSYDYCAVETPFYQQRNYLNFSDGVTCSEQANVYVKRKRSSTLQMGSPILLLYIL